MDDLIIKPLGEGFPEPSRSPSAGETGAAKSFGEFLKESLETVNRLQKEADQAVRDLALGRGQNLHQAMIAMEKAEVSFRLMMQVRNKIVAAYEEIMRTQL